MTITIKFRKNTENRDPENGDNETYKWPEANDIESYDNLIRATFLMDKHR